MRAKDNHETLRYDRIYLSEETRVTIYVTQKGTLRKTKGMEEVNTGNVCRHMLKIFNIFKGDRIKTYDIPYQKTGDKEATMETRYYISSLNLTRTHLNRSDHTGEAENNRIGH